jgi:hypothetical protein
MLISVIATICIGALCRDELVTTSAIDERATMQYCSVMGQPALAAWVGDHWPGYRLAGWKCDSGHRGMPV